MANHKSAEKRNRQNSKIRVRNRSARANVRTAMKKASAAQVAGSADAATLVRSAESIIAKAANKGLYHPKNAARKVSRLAKKLAAAKNSK